MFQRLFEGVSWALSSAGREGVLLPQEGVGGLSSTKAENLKLDDVSRCFFITETFCDERERGIFPLPRRCDGAAEALLLLSLLGLLL